jgi:arabinogalactan oligomer / maltooligosaccharide transport system permease protein
MKNTVHNTANNTFLHVLKAVASSLVWGLGQLLNRQFLKAFFFFLFFAALILVEYNTSNYSVETDPYDKVIGDDFAPNLAQKFHEKYVFNVQLDFSEPLADYETYYAEVSADGEFSNVELYEYIVQDFEKVGLNSEGRYEATPFSTEFKNYMTDIYNKPGNTYDMQDFTRFTIELYFMSDPEFRADFEERFNNFYYDQAGFFVKGIWSIFTLGETPSLTFSKHNQFSTLTPDGKYLLTTVSVQGHQSTHLLLEGIISTIILMYFVIIMIWNIVDAYRTSKQIEIEGEVPNEITYFKDVYENAFEYIVLFPAFFTISIISIMPILFGFLIAFTNYDFEHLNFVDWVGLKNFGKLFRFADSDIPFGKMFPKVFTWTLVWAILSTATVFLVGFIQALILNNSRVVFRKMWRSFLILPWAVPALISQMIFKIMFHDRGVVNSFLNDIGVYGFLKKLGMLGKDANTIEGFWQTITYLGNSDIQWLSNSVNYNFVRAVIIVINIWLGFPFFMALLTGVMTGIDKTLYEAADIDGATNKDKFRFITFPLVIYSVAPLLLMTFSGNFNNFGVIYFITEGGHGAGQSYRAYAGTTDILISWMYSLTVDHQLYGMASVFSILIFLIIGTVSAWNFTRMKAFKED